MPERTVRVGDVVAWMDVPNGANVKSPFTGDTALRLNDQCHYTASGVTLPPSPWGECNR